MFAVVELFWLWHS